jgi:hypothetical protein
MFLQQRVHLKTALKSKEPPNLGLRQRAGPIRLNGDRLERAPRDIAIGA